jgi:PAS domain S-box-containing protein
VTESGSETSSSAVLRALEEQLRCLSDSLPGGVIYQVVRRPDGSNYFPYMSAGLERTFGISPAEAMRDPMRVYERILPDDLRRLRAAADESIRSGTPFDVECRLRTPENAERWLHVRGRPNRLPDGATLWNAVALDVTERKRTEEVLRESERRYRLLADHVTDVIFTTDLGLWPTYISPSITRITGYSLEEAMERSLGEHLTAASHGLLSQTLVDWLGAACPTERPMSTLLELEFRCKNGSTVWTEVHCTLARDPAGRPTGLIGVMRDISRRKAAEDTLRQMERRLAVSQERERLAGALHDALSAVLFSIGLKVDWCLQRLPEPSPMKSKLEEIKHDSADMMRAMRAQILQLASEPSGSRKASERLAGLVAEFENLSGLEARLLLVGDLAIVDESVEEVLQRILQEAFVNVAKHARASRIVVRLQIADNEARFEVTDDGVGPPADLARLVGAPGHFGIRGMRERLHTAGGWLEVGAAGERGFRVRGALPLTVTEA